MPSFFALLLFPLVWPFVAKRLWNRDITWLEMVLNIAIVVLLVTAVWEIGRYGKMADVEIWNGEVTGKEKNSVPCSHSYSCNCRETCSGTGSNRSCSATCDTCYEHFNDWDWDVSSTAGKFTIDRIDRRGSNEPPRWTRVAIGEPVALPHSFENYIKAAPDSLFHRTGRVGGTYTSLLPVYPAVYDYQWIDRVIPVGLALPEKTEWNKELALALRKLGPARQVNVIIVAVKTPDQDYVHALEEHWLGGKKNDVVVILGVPEYPKISWAAVMSWTKEELFKVELRDALLALGHIDNAPVIETIEKHVSTKFVRRQMKDFEYLKDEIDPPTWALVLAFLLATVGSIGLSLWFRETDIG